MSFTDPIADMITRIRNAQLRTLETVSIPNSKFRAKILDVLKDEGFISDYKFLSNTKNKGSLIVNLKYSNGEIAQLSASISFITPHEARIYVHKGKIVVSDFYHPQEYSIFLTGGGEPRVHKPFKGFGYHFEAVEAQNCLLSNKQESEIFPLENSLNVLTIMDSLRKQLGIVYPNDKSI